jgi:chorismate-pyruvate lyase
MRELCMETYREILWHGREDLVGLTPGFATLSSNGFVSRTYRIFAAGSPIMLIHEKFPLLVS